MEDVKGKELYKLLKKSIGKKPIKMKDLAAKCGFIEAGASVGTSIGARMRVQLKKLAEDGAIVIEGARATTTYRKA